MPAQAYRKINAADLIGRQAQLPAPVAGPKGQVALIGRWRLSDADRDRFLDRVVLTRQKIRINGTVHWRGTLRGVAGRHADVIVSDLLASPTGVARTPVLEVTDRPDYIGPTWVGVIEAGTKAGRYDGRQRRRYALRAWRPRDAERLSPASIRLHEQDATLELLLLPADAPALIDRWPVLRTDLERYNLARICGWQWRRYYTHLTDEDGMRQVCDGWAAEVEATGEWADWTLAEANQAASRYLYRFSIAQGWRKLTLREKAALGIDRDAPQWWREDALAGLYQAHGHWSATGLGEATLIAASQGHWPAVDAGLTELEAMAAEFDEAYRMR